MKALFLDRDGVINQELEGSYILRTEDFHFYDGVLDAFKILKDKYDLFIVVTNQRCVGKGLLSEDTLHDIHKIMVDRIYEYAELRINSIYYAPAIHDHDRYRKPNIGMGLQAKEDFPQINFEDSVMVGNNLSDMKFGKKLGMKTIFLHTTKDKVQLPHHLIDEQYGGLLSFAHTL